MRRTVVLAVLFASATFAAVVGSAWAASAPVAATGAAKDVGQTQATLTARVDPQGSATTVSFELGTSTSYGLQSATKDAGSGTGPVTVEIPVQGLTQGTTYHFRVVATSAAGTTRGLDAAFTTAKPPAAPSISTTGAREATPTGVTILGTVNPNGAATSYHVDYGPTTSYGSSTPAVDAGGGTTGVGVRVRIENLQPGKRYHYRIVAGNSVGNSRASDRTFTTVATPTSATLAASGDPVTYGRPVTLTGTLGGSKRSGVRVRLQLTSFPFNSPFADTLTPVVSSSSGTFSFTLPAVTLTTRAVAIADGAPEIVSRVVVIRSAVRAGITAVGRSGRTVTISGRLTPATQQGVAALQRQTAAGGWVPIRRVRTGPDGRYAITLRARRQAMLVRTVGLPHDGGGHARGFSRTVAIRGQ
jgi:hypothetical protein